MLKLHCDICDRDMSKDANTTKVTWEDNEGYENTGFGVFRKPRKLTIDICDDCLKLLKENARVVDDFVYVCRSGN